MNPLKELLAKATALPWKLYHGKSSGITSIMKGTKEVIFWTGFNSSHFPKKALPNAALLTIAVNNFPAVVEALKILNADFNLCRMFLDSQEAREKGGKIVLDNQALLAKIDRECKEAIGDD